MYKEKKDVEMWDRRGRKEFQNIYWRRSTKNFYDDTIILEYFSSSSTAAEHFCYKVNCLLSTGKKWIFNIEWMNMCVVIKENYDSNEHFEVKWICNVKKNTQRETTRTHTSLLSLFLALNQQLFTLLQSHACKVSILNWFYTFKVRLFA